MLLPGDRIGDWVVESVLGEGGMGSVFRCHNALTPRIRAAVKVLKPDHFDDVRVRFMREVEALDGLNHPAIVRVKGWGEDPVHGTLWLAMDLVDGVELTERVRRGPMPDAELQAVFSQLAAGLAHAHERHIFHRDIKPANILLREAGPVLVDFGIALDADQSRMTARGVVPGTPAYMAPEAFRGDPDPRLLDIYAFGQVMHEAAVGGELYPADGTMSTTQRIGQIAILKTQVEALDPGASASPELRAIIAEATAPMPEQRIADMATLVGRFSGEPSVFVPTTSESGIPWQLWLGVAVGAALGLAAVLVLVKHKRSQESAEPVAVEAPSDAQPEPVVAPPEPVAVIAAEPDPVAATEPEQPSEATIVAEPEPAPVVVPAPAQVASEPALRGLKIKVLHRKAQRQQAERGAGMLRKAGADVTVVRGEEGPMWQPYWGNTYHGSGRAEAALHVQGMLSELGYLDPQASPDLTDWDLVVWLPGG